MAKTTQFDSKFQIMTKQIHEHTEFHKHLESQFCI